MSGEKKVRATASARAKFRHCQAAFLQQHLRSLPEKQSSAGILAKRVHQGMMTGFKTHWYQPGEAAKVQQTEGGLARQSIKLAGSKTMLLVVSHYECTKPMALSLHATSQQHEAKQTGRLNKGENRAEPG